MPTLFSKIVKISLYSIVLISVMSGAKIDEQIIYSNTTYGDYTMQVSGNLNDNLKGTVSFETSIEQTSQGDSFSTLKLKLNNNKKRLPHSMEFLISRENTTNPLPVDIYQVSRDQEGFLNFFDGVFGFANINVLGELPLFAQSGTIQIKYIDTSTVRGILNIKMGNSTGKSVQITGNFTATK